MLKRRIMVVNNNNDHFDVLSSMLNHLGYDDIVVARNAKEALNYLQESSCDLIFSDLWIPVINGIDLLKIVKKRIPEILFVIYTAYGDSYSYIEAMEQGAFEYINRPVDMKKLREIINNCFVKKEVTRKKAK